jgi:hypothetical protein
MNKHPVGMVDTTQLAAQLMASQFAFEKEKRITETLYGWNFYTNDYRTVI